MNTTIQLQKNAAVLAADGQHVGSLERVVVNPNSNVLTDIVVRTGNLMNHKEKVVPIELVAETTEDKILLRDEAGDLESLPVFEEQHLVDPYGEGGEGSRSPGSGQPMIFGYPGAGMPLVTVPSEQFITQTEQNIPEGTVAMKEGAKVIASDGKHIGVVQRVVVDPAEDQVTHLLISRGLLTKETKLIPIDWVMTVGEDKVQLWVNKDSFDELEEDSVPE